ncbi:uncharacterized protein BDW70DRAFT_165595 [Aspergillus foveolatus]|uniref:uncharacterized protein n=1 Tax=Aspergillus foveolatus TaxID=210207 RepID=UPI003CCE2441
MHMNLRKSIRLPQHFNPDHFYGPMSRRSLRGDDRKKPAYIDYNPDLPPAAFPTLERPRAAIYGHDIHQRDNDEDRLNKASRRNSRRSLDDLCASVNLKGKREASPTAHVREIPLDQLDNYVASNGELNPIWVSNMARMAAAGKDADGDMDMEDTDLEGTVTGECRSISTGPQNPTWADLSPRMRAEIFQNLLEHHSYPAVCRMLGLTVEERDAIADILEIRRKQIEQEDTQLDAMRAKQLRELSKVDHSFRTQKQSYQLVFRKASRQTFRVLRDFIEPDRDFFACKSSELTVAKTFLDKRGIEHKFVGIWGNGSASIHASDGEAPPLGRVGFDGAPGPKPVFGTTKEAHARHLTTVPESQSETAATSKTTFTDWLGNSPAGSLLENVQHNGKQSTPGKYLAHFKEAIDQEKGRCTRNRRQISAFGLHESRPVPSEIPHARSSSPLDRHSSEKLALKHRQQQQPQRQNNHSPRPSSTPNCLPKNKKTFRLPLPLQSTDGELSPHRVKARKIPYSRPSTNGRSAGTRQVQNIQQQRLIEIQAPQVSTADTISDHLEWLQEEPLWTAELPSSPETGLSQSSDLPTPQTVATNTSLSSTRAGYRGRLVDEDETEDEFMHWDEMVLLPSD